MGKDIKTIMLARCSRMLRNYLGMLRRFSPKKEKKTSGPGALMAGLGV
jgi:hypothetical protein